MLGGEGRSRRCPSCRVRCSPPPPTSFPLSRPAAHNVNLSDTALLRVERDGSDGEARNERGKIGEEFSSVVVPRQQRSASLSTLRLPNVLPPLLLQTPVHPPRRETFTLVVSQRLCSACLLSFWSARHLTSLVSSCLGLFSLRSVTWAGLFRSLLDPIPSITVPDARRMVLFLFHVR